jgi:MazG family protein
MDHNEGSFRKLVELMDTLREPGGCPWDREQTRETLKPMLVEESYEVLEALDSDNADEICEELGDLLFQIIFHSRISKERGEFDAYEVCRRVYEKMVGRHPHVFGDASFSDSRELLKHWEEIKAAEKQRSGSTTRKKSLLDGIPESMPALYTAYQLTSKASRVGFDWTAIEGIRDKFLEEFEELKEALANNDQKRVQEEVGDLLFSALNIARYLQIDPETALRKANRKFSRRFREMERSAGEQGKNLRELDLDEMEKIWQDLKRSSAVPER